jgi:hypothetical protein
MLEDLDTDPTESTLPLLLKHDLYIRENEIEVCPTLCCSFQCCVRSHRRRRRKNHRSLISPLARVRNLLPINGRCFHSHYLADGSTRCNITTHPSCRSCKWHLFHAYPLNCSISPMRGVCETHLYLHNFTMLYCSSLLHCKDLTLRLAFTLMPRTLHMP